MNNKILVVSGGSIGSSVAKHLAEKGSIEFQIVIKPSRNSGKHKKRKNWQSPYPS